MGTQLKQIHHNTPITNFYKGKSVFLTGATGYLGTVLLEKLLYSCAGMKNIYILVKSKKYLNAEERLELLLKTVPFKRLQEQNPAVFKKIIVINGNVAYEKLGIIDEDMEKLRKNVSIVFHVAADISFHRVPVDTVNINTRGTGRLLEFCRTIQNLEVIVYVSTAYCNIKSNNDIIDENINITCTSVQSALHAIDHCSTNNSLVSNLIAGRCNWYTYSKALTEQFIGNEFTDLPIAVVRPSIILAALNEPVPGWIQGWTGANSVVALQSLSLLRVWRTDTDAVVDIIPVDFVASILIAAAWDTHTKRLNGETKIKVFNICSGLRNPLTYGIFFNITTYCNKILYRNESLIPPSIFLIKNPILYSVIFFFLQTIPAYVIDGLYHIFLQKPRMMEVHSKIKKMLHHLKFFTLNQFTFIDHNVRELYLNMDKDDQAIFDFDVKNIDWQFFLETYATGLKKYVIKNETMM